MTWDEFLNKPVQDRWHTQIETDIECPKCGRKIYLDDTIEMTSYPGRYKYWCSCGWTGHAPLKYERGGDE